MDLRCNKCSQKYYVPDHKLSDKQSYFYCEKCGQKIVIQRKAEGWESFRGLSFSSLSAKDFLEGIFFSFNIKGLLVSFFALCLITLIVLIATVIAYNSVEFFIGHPYFSLFLAVLVSSVIIFIYDLHLYLLSKNTFHRIRTGRNMLFSVAINEILHDIKPMYFLSTGIFILLVLLVVPVYPSEGHGILYGAVIYPLLLFSALLLVFIQTLKSIIYSFVGLKSRGFSNTLRSLCRFIAIENINIPLYLIMIYAVAGLIFFIITLIIGGGLVFLTLLLIPRFSPDMLNSIIQGIAAHQSAHANHFLGFIAGLDLSLRPAFVILLVWFYTIGTFISAYFHCLVQSMSSVAVYIMECNPGRSLSRRLIIVAAVLMMLSAAFLIILMA